MTDTNPTPTRILRLGRRFLTDRRAAIAPIFAIASIPLMAGVGGAVDFARAYQQRTAVQDAIDAAALAANRRVGLASRSEIIAEATAYYTTNVADRLANPPAINVDIDGSTVTVTTTLHVPTYFIGFVGLNEITFDIAAKTTAGMGTLEVVMALDNSGSMSGSKISTLRTAATNLTDTLFNLATASTKPDPIKIGVVPFAAAVNVGPAYYADSSATWLDKNGVASYNGENFEIGSHPAAVNQFDLFAGIRNVSWAGCVEARPQPYDVSDDSPTSAKPATFFVPMFAPDEPDNWTCTTSKCSYNGSRSARAYSGAPSGSQSYNNYLPDNAGVCSTSADRAYTNGSNEQAALARTCKYGSASSQVTPSGVSVAGLPGGPNFMCTTPALLPMTDSKSKIASRINEMAAEGATNILSGVVWGWRLLSPGAPFTQGRDYDTKDNQKILVLMTDGENTYYPNSSFVRSWYGAFSYVAQDHLGTTSTNSDTLASAMNDRTILACDNAKKAGVTIYTVGFDISGSSRTATDRALAVLKQCASDPAKYFEPNSNDELLSAFDAIGTDISNLRITY